MSNWEYLLLFGSVMLGGIIGFVIPVRTRSRLQLVLSFSGAYIIGIVVLHIMPSVFANADRYAGIWVLAGFFSQLVLEQLSAGIEHGHLHTPHKLTPAFVLSVLFSLSLHAFVEGMPLSFYEEIHAAHGHPQGETLHYLIGIILHHLPAAYALTVLLLMSKLNRKWVWVCLIVFSAMPGLGALVSANANLLAFWQRGILGFAMGSLLHIATVILFEMDGSSHKYLSVKRLMAIAAGLGIALTTLL